MRTREIGILARELVRNLEAIERGYYAYRSLPQSMKFKDISLLCEKMKEECIKKDREDLLKKTEFGIRGIWLAR